MRGVGGPVAPRAARSRVRTRSSVGTRGARLSFAGQERPRGAGRLRTGRSTSGSRPAPDPARGHLFLDRPGSLRRCLDLELALAAVIPSPRPAELTWRRARPHPGRRPLLRPGLCLPLHRQLRLQTLSCLTLSHCLGGLVQLAQRRGKCPLRQPPPWPKAFSLWSVGPATGWPLRWLEAWLAVSPGPGRDSGAGLRGGDRYTRAASWVNSASQMPGEMARAENCP